MNITNLKTFLNKRLSDPLPGRDSHVKMAPIRNENEIRELEPSPDARHSAVLILVNDKKELLFTLRSEKLRKHSGQISFPGGRADEGEDSFQTALRETREEVGINEEYIEAIGTLSDLYVPPSNSVITPVVGTLKKETELILNPDEVSEAFYYGIDKFYNDKLLKYRHTVWKGKKFRYPYWDVHEKVPLWGATAIIMQEFLDIYDEFRQNNY